MRDPSIIPIQVDKTTVSGSTPRVCGCSFAELASSGSMRCVTTARSVVHDRTRGDGSARWWST